MCYQLLEGQRLMAFTREFKETVLELCNGSEYRKALLIESLQTYLDGDVVAGNTLLRNYLNGTQSFSEVAKEIGVLEPSLRRMLSSNGNARVRNFFPLIKVCLERENLNSVDLLVH